MQLDNHNCDGKRADHRLGRVSTPVNVESLEAKLKHHPDRDYVQYIACGLRHGFHIGIKDSADLTAAKHNMLSADQNPSVIDSYLKAEGEAGNTFANGLEWGVSQEGVEDIFHYLHDFAVLGAPGSPECEEALQALKRLCAEWNVTLAEDKQDGPARPH